MVSCVLTQAPGPARLISIERLQELVMPAFSLKAAKLDCAKAHTPRNFLSCNQLVYARAT